jgi:predicted patatin/cPLA2 family phospholipase
MSFYWLISLLADNFVPNKLNVRKKALIVEGGGFKSAFSAGVLDVLLTFKYAPADTPITALKGAYLNVNNTSKTPAEKADLKPPPSTINAFFLTFNLFGTKLSANNDINQ